MPPKSRDFKAKAKWKPSNPQSEIEYLEAADEHEQAAVSSTPWFRSPMISDIVIERVVACCVVLTWAI
jgi:hypothetical protein